MNSCYLQETFAFNEFEWLINRVFGSQKDDFLLEGVEPE